MRNKFWITLLFVLFGLSTIAASCNLSSPIVNSNPTEVAAVNPTQTERVVVVTATPLPPTITPEASPTVISTATPEPTAALPPTATLEVTATVTTIYTATSALNYPALVAPDPSRQTMFPDVANGNRPALVAYEVPFEDGDYFEAGHGDVDLPQYYFRVMTAGTVKIDQLGVNCVATPTKGCAVILINHFGETAMFRNATVDNGFTVAGLVFDMSGPDKVTLAAQALADHYVYRMTVYPNDGANCSVRTGCVSVEWHVVVVGNGEAQIHWTGVFTR